MLALFLTKVRIRNRIHISKKMAGGVLQVANINISLYVFHFHFHLDCGWFDCSVAWSVGRSVGRFMSTRSEKLLNLFRFIAFTHSDIPNTKWMRIKEKRFYFWCTYFSCNQNGKSSLLNRSPMREIHARTRFKQLERNGSTFT